LILDFMIDDFKFEPLSLLLTFCAMAQMQTIGLK